MFKGLRVDSGLDKAKICSDRRVDADRPRLRAVFGEEKRFLHSLDPKRTRQTLPQYAAVDKKARPGLIIKRLRHSLGIALIATNECDLNEQDRAHCGDP
jgi:hypothetical protein